MKDFLEWIQTRQRREQREGEMSVGERQPRARQRLECVELAPAFWRRVVVGVVVDVAKAPASRAQSKRFAQLEARGKSRQRLECGDSSPLSVHERKPDRGGFARAASKSASKLAHSKRWRAIRDAFESPAFGHNSTFPGSLESGAAVTRSFVLNTIFSATLPVCSSNTSSCHRPC